MVKFVLACGLFLLIGFAYSQTMPPASGYAEQLRIDMAVIDALADAGSNMTAEHQLEQHFLASQSVPLELIRAWAKSRGYATTPITEAESDGETYFYFDVITPVVPTIDNVHQLTTEMLNLAGQHGAVFDGWGCKAVR